MKKKSYIEEFKAALEEDSFWAETAKIEFVSELYGLMEKKGLSKADFARILGKSQPYVTKIFRGDANFTIDSMVRLSRAVGCRLHIHLAEEGVVVQWPEIVPPRKEINGLSWADGYKKLNNLDKKGQSDEEVPAAA